MGYEVRTEVQELKCGDEDSHTELRCQQDIIPQPYQSHTPKLRDDTVAWSFELPKQLLYGQL